MGKQSILTRSNAAPATDGFTADDRKLLNSLLQYSKAFDEKLDKMKSYVKACHGVMLKQNKEINNLRCLINTSNYQGDAQEQYIRRECTDLLKVDGLEGSAIDIMMGISKVIEEEAPPYQGEKVSINLQPSDIHRCHFLGTGAKKRIICRFTPAAYGKKMKLLLNKRHINQKKTGKYKEVFLAENLTPMRKHLLWYIKTNFSDDYHKVHTRNGTIKMKEKSDDSNSGDWISVNNPDDLHKLVGDRFIVKEFNNSLKPFQVLDMIPAPTFAINFFDDDVANETDENVDLTAS